MLSVVQKMRLPRSTLNLAYRSLCGRLQTTSARRSPTSSQSHYKRPQNPFDKLGYQLVEQSHTTEPHATQRSVIDALGPSSFTVSGVRVAGSVFIMPFFSTLWNVQSMHQITSHAFALVKIVLPRPDILVIGTGAQLLPVSPQLRKFFETINVNIDAMDTKNACHTFNILNQEGRNAAAALLPVGYHHQSKS